MKRSRKDDPNVITAPFFTIGGLQTVVTKIIERYTPDFENSKTKMSGSGVEAYDVWKRGQPYQDRDYDIYFPVGDVIHGRHIAINVCFKGDGYNKRTGRRRYVSGGKVGFKVTVTYSRDDWKPTKYNKKGFKQEFWSTKNSFNLNLVFNGIDEARKYMLEKINRENGQEKIAELEKIAFDAMFSGDWPYESTGNVTFDDKKKCLNYWNRQKTQNEDDSVDSTIHEYTDTEGKKFYALHQLRLQFENKYGYKEKRMYKFLDQEQLRMVLDLSREFTLKISNILKESLYVEKVKEN